MTFANWSPSTQDRTLNIAKVAGVIATVGSVVLLVGAWVGGVL